MWDGFQVRRPASAVVATLILNAQGNEMPVYDYLCNDCGPFTDIAADGGMRRAAELPEMREPIAPRHADGAELLLHALGQAQGLCHQRAQRQRPQNTR